MTYLYRHPKVRCLISLAHGEGWGLPIFEAVYNGLPVMCPAWGGQNDFIHMPIKDKKTLKVKETCMVANVSYDIKNIQPEAHYTDMLIPESQWAFPRDWHARQQMRDLHKNYGFYKSRALKLQDFIKEKYEMNKMYSKFANAVCEDYNVVDVSKFLMDDVLTEVTENVVEYA